MNDEPQDQPSPATPQTCAYRRGPYTCSEPAWPECNEGFCVFHSPNNDVMTEQIWSKARQMVTDPLNTANFQGWYFPRDRTEDTKGFTGPIQCDVNFADAVFKGPAYFLSAEFRGRVSFLRCRFDGETDFTDAVFGEKQNEYGRHPDVDFGHAKFNGSLLCHRTKFHGFTNFSWVQFKHAAEFPKAFFGHCVAFVRAQFGTSLNFEDATFVGWAMFKGTQAPAECSLSLPLPRKKWKVFGEASPFRDPSQGEQAYRLAKAASQNIGDYRRAGDYHFAEQCAIESGRRKNAEWQPWEREFWSRENWFLCLPETIVARWMFGYGERPWRVLLTGGVVILLFALLYCLRGGIVPADAEVPFRAGDWWQSLYFSIVTFTTLGFGDLRPAAGWRIIVGFEALIGAGLMAMFVVSLTRRYMR